MQRSQSIHRLAVQGLKRLEGGQGGGGDPFNSFFDFFGGGGGQRQQGGMPKGYSLEFPLVVTLRDLYLGERTFVGVCVCLIATLHRA